MLILLLQFLYANLAKNINKLNLRFPKIEKCFGREIKGQQSLNSECILCLKMGVRGRHNTPRVGPEKKTKDFFLKIK